MEAGFDAMNPIGVIDMEARIPILNEDEGSNLVAMGPNLDLDDGAAQVGKDGKDLIKEA